jgi:hypothetical protein
MVLFVYSVLSVAMILFKDLKFFSIWPNNCQDRRIFISFVAVECRV